MKRGKSLSILAVGLLAVSVPVSAYADATDGLVCLKMKHGKCVKWGKAGDVGGTNTGAGAGGAGGAGAGGGSTILYVVGGAAVIGGGAAAAGGGGSSSSP